ncbi:MAG: LuxR C-terminal-related transcriptional regulator [Chloroflexota bacterium]
MSDGLLQTKLFIPPLRPLLVSRNRLVDLLNQNSHSKLTLISAPAGFGKTTLVLGWLSEMQSRLTPSALACWISLDENDNESNRFFTYLIAAVRTAVPTFGNSLLAALQSAQPPNETAVIQTLLNQLTNLKEPLVIVLDDYHLINHATVHDALSTLIEHLPPQVKFIITSRDAPPLPLPRWRARGQLTEIRADDLRFNIDEAADFFKQTMGLQIETEAVFQLEQRTEGWVAGLQLAALSLQGQENPAQQVAAFSGNDRHIADYLLAEVLEQQPEDIQHFLQQTAVLERLSAPLCNALLGVEQGSLKQPHAQAILEQLETANLFLIPLDNQRRWYRYHHLFADLLRERLRQAEGETAVRQQHKRAAEWYESQSLLEEAVRHAFQAHAYDYAGRLIATIPVDSLWRQGGATLLQKWGQALPSTVILAYPPIAIRIATAHLIVGNIQQAQQYLDMAQNKPEVDAEWHLLEAILMRNQGKVPQALEFSQYALENMAANQYNLRAFAQLQLVSNFLDMAELDKAEQIIFLIRRQYEQIDISSQLYVHRMAGVIATQRADFEGAASFYRDGFQIPGAALQPLIATLYNGLAFLNVQQLELEAAAAYYGQAKQWADDTGLTDILFDTYLGEAELACWRGEYQHALDIMAQFRAFAEKSNLATIIKLSELFDIIFHLKVGQLETAVQWVVESGITVHDKLNFKNFSQYKLFIATLIRQSEQTKDTGQLSPLAQLAERLLALFRQRGFILEAIDLLTWMTLLHHLNDEPEKAKACLQSALKYAEPSGIKLPFVARGTLLYKVLHQLPPSPFIKQLLQAFESTEISASVEQTSAVLLEPLTEREQDVLRCLAAGLSNRAIEEKLFISKNTVRTHLKNLYGKLGVNGRHEAITRAKTLNLI